MRWQQRFWAIWLTLMAVAAACTSTPVADAPTTTSRSQPSTTEQEVVVDTSLPPVPDMPAGIAPDPDPTPLPIDNAVRIGRLENGLTYYARSNQAPGSAVAVRLAVNAGSLQQEVPDDNVAHFLEHMMFNGTDAYPANTLDSTLRNLGAQIGPDLNAFTSFDETVYQLDVTITGDNVETAVGVVREWAGRALLDPAEVAAERGVVREEFRLARDGPGAELNRLFEDVYLSGTPYEGRSPIGEEDKILGTEAEVLRRFYDRWYRPDNMAVIVVGDLSLDEMEELVVDQFEDLEARGDDHPDRETPEIEPISEPFVRVLHDPELPGTFVSLDYWAPKWDGSTVGGERLQVWDQLALLMVTNRITNAVNSGASQLIRGGGGPFTYARETAFYGFNVDASDLAAGAGELVGRINQTRVSGFTDDELARAVEEVDAGQDQALAGIRTRQDAQWADLYAFHFLGQVEISSAEETNQRVDQILADVTAAEITEYFRWVMNQSAPLVIVVGPDDADLPEEEAVAAAIFDNLGGLDVGPADEVAEIDELMSPPAPVVPTNVVSVDALGSTEFLFENGARVEFQESSISAESVNFWAQSKGGFSLLAPEDQAVAQIAAEMVGQSGVADFSKASVERFLASKVVGVVPFIDETREGVFGSSSTEDLEVLFQWVHLLLTQPALDDVAFQRRLTQAEESLRAQESSPTDSTFLELAEILNGDNPGRDVTLDFADLDALTPQRALEIYRSRLVGVDDLVVAITGDVSSAEVEDLAARYIGTLPTRPADTWQDINPDPPRGVVRSDLTVGSGNASGSFTIALFGSPTDSNENQTGIQVLQSVLDERLFTQIRESLGASYGGGQAILQISSEPDEVASTVIVVVGDADRLEEIRSVVLGELADLAANGPDQGEFERALAIIEDGNRFVNNQQLQEQLHDYADGASPVLTTAEIARVLSLLTRGDVARLARQMLPTDSWVEISATPR